MFPRVTKKDTKSVLDFTTRIWFDEWDTEKRQYMLDRLLVVCTTAPPEPPAAQDELVSLLGSMQVCK